jgi:CRP-like cAMP-binding protein
LKVQHAYNLTMATAYSFEQSSLYLALLGGAQRDLRRNQVFQTTDQIESLTLIRRGYVKRYKINHAGIESIQGIYGPGDVLPVTSILKILLDLPIYQGPETFYYETLTEVAICTMAEKVLTDLAAKDPLIYRDVAYIAGVRLRTYIHNFENMSVHSTEKRLAHQLLFHAEQFGQKTSKGTKILVPLKQKELAALVDVARETVTIKLKVLRDKGLISEGSNLIPDMEKLREFAYS